MGACWQGSPTTTTCLMPRLRTIKASMNRAWAASSTKSYKANNGLKHTRLNLKPMTLCGRPYAMAVHRGDVHSFSSNHIRFPQVQKSRNLTHALPFNPAASWTNALWLESVSDHDCAIATAMYTARWLTYGDVKLLSKVCVYWALVCTIVKQDVSRYCSIERHGRQPRLENLHLFSPCLMFTDNKTCDPFISVGKTHVHEGHAVECSGAALIQCCQDDIRPLDKLANQLPLKIVQLKESLPS